MANKKRLPASQKPAAKALASQSSSADDATVGPDDESPDLERPVIGWKQRLISLVLVLHLTAVALPPMMFQSGGSAWVATLLTPFRAYTEFLYLDRGYAFFAPNPGPSHLIQAAVTQSDGQRTETMYPDLDQQWPRLLYHRHFMLAEFLTEIYQPPGPPRELVEMDRLAAEDWVRLRARYEHVRQSIVDHLRHEHDEKPVAIRRIEHLIPSAQEYLSEDIQLTNPLLYDVLRDLPLTSPPPIAAPPESIPPPVATQDLVAPVESEAIDEASTSEAVQ